MEYAQEGELGTFVVNKGAHLLHRGISGSLGGSIRVNCSPCWEKGMLGCWGFSLSLGTFLERVARRK